MSVTANDSDVGSKNRYRDAPRKADHTIDQQWASYSAAEHDRWDRLFSRSQATLKDRACDDFIAMMHALKLSESGIPDMERLSDRLAATTGWRVVPVAGLVPDEVFFDHLASRRFPAGAFIRSEQEMDYLQEPDIFHDVFGHVPLLANPVYADFMQAYGRGSQRAMSLGMLPNLARLYWYTVEFGLIRQAGALRIFGAGIMSSTAESVFALEDSSPNRIAFNLERVMRTKYIIDDFQQTYFVIPSLEALLRATADVDFEPIYDPVSLLPELAPGMMEVGDKVTRRGTQMRLMG
jgi:phenylalanine-4-hydroxylase